MGSATRVDREELIGALRLRYDHYSAVTVLGVALERAGLSEQPGYDAAQVQALRAALARVGDRLAAVDARLEELVGGAPATAAPDKPAAAQKPAAAAVAEQKPAAAAPEKPGKATAEKAHATAAEHAAGAPQATAGVTIALTGVEADEDAEVLVCGGFPALGDWDPERALPMARRGDAWLASIDVAPGTELAFKFLQRRASGEVVWEDGENRTAVAAPRIDATWR